MSYFEKMKPYMTLSNADGTRVYSFALEPEEHQLTGTSAFHRIDTNEKVYISGTIGMSCTNPSHTLEHKPSNTTYRSKL